MLWCLLEITQATNDSSQQVRRSMHERTADAVVLHIIPYELVRVEFWRIRWQKERKRVGVAPGSVSRAREMMSSS